MSGGTPAFVRAIGRALGAAGRALDAQGLTLQGAAGVKEKLVASTRIVAAAGKYPTHGVDAFVASTASLIGDVRLGEGASAWYGATLRGDGAAVSLGRNASVGDNALVTASARGGPSRVGDDATVCAGAVVTSSLIGDGAMIGPGAVLGAGCVVGADAFVDAGAVLPAGAAVPPGQAWSGAPAAYLRALTADEMSFLRSAAGETAELGRAHGAQLAKDTPSLEFEAAVRDLKLEGSFAPDTPVSKPDADIEQYYKLTAPGEQAGLFRSVEYDLEAELAAREAAEVAADAAENAKYAALAADARLGEAIRRVSVAAGAGAARAVVAELAARDPASAATLRQLSARAAGVVGLPAGHASKEGLLREVLALSPEGVDGADRLAEAAGLVEALAKKAPELAAAAVGART